MNYQVRYTPHAERQLQGLPQSVQPRIEAAVSALAHDPQPPGCRKMRGRPGAWRIRVGDYRVIYEVDEVAQTVLVTDIGRRDSIY